EVVFAVAMTFMATRPQSARPSSAVASHHRAKTNKITLGMYRFRPGTSSLEKVGPVDVHTPVLTLLALLADDTSPFTVIVGRQSEPTAWYHTNKDGYVLKKHPAHCTWKHVREALCGGRHSPDYVATHDNKNIHWPVAVAKFDDGRLRVLTRHALLVLLKELETACPGQTNAVHPFCIQAFVPPAKRVRYISIYTLVRNVGDCHVVVAELTSNYKEQPHDNGDGSNDVDITKEPIEILEAVGYIVENSLMVESIKRTTLLLIHHVNRKQSASSTPVISKLIAEYMIHTKDNEVYLTAILGTETTILSTREDQGNNQGGRGGATHAVTKQVKAFARSLQGSTELYEAAERHASECQDEAAKLQQQVAALEVELDQVKAKLDTSTAHADAQRKIKCLEGRIELQDRQIATLESTVAVHEASAVTAAAGLDRERVLFCEALTASQAKVDSLTAVVAQLEREKSELHAQVLSQAHALHAAAGTVEALQGAVDKQKLLTHQVSSSLRELQVQVNLVEAENDKFKALLPFASVKKVNWCSKMHLHEFAMDWPEYRMEIGVLNRCLSAHFSVLKRIFSQFAKVKVPLVAPHIALGRTHPLLPNQLNYAQLVALLERCHIVTTRCSQFTPPQVEPLFTKCTAARWHQTHGPKLTTAGMSLPRGLLLVEFMELLVRVAHVRGGGKSGLVAESLHKMVEDCIYPHVHWKDVEAAAMVFTGYCFRDRDEVEPLAEETSTGPTFEWCQRHATRLHCLVACGYVEKASDGNLYNSMMVLSPDGTVVFNYRKVLRRLYVGID
ncbi:hypothetical protein DYB28_005558, partial [Aphanomyces astaci]